uniref:NCD3G domain-containing protein n=1 Tax=Gongylonema pulchrum TaxID=637853 RepID=A0A183EK50_9BILA
LNDLGSYQKVGKWIAGRKLDLNVERVRNGLKNWRGALPLSVCSTDCPRGHYRAYQDQSCCWTCIPCDVSTSIIINETSCVQCPLGHAPDEDLLVCRPILPTTLEYDSPWVVLPAAFSAVGIVATLFVVGVIFENHFFITFHGRPAEILNFEKKEYETLEEISKAVWLGDALPWVTLQSLAGKVTR